MRLERDQATGPSAGVVDAVADVLRLDDDERAHLDRLLAALTPAARKRSRVAAKDPVSPGLRVLLDSLDHLPAVGFNGRLDLLAVNTVGRALYAPVYDQPGRPNSARFLFLDEPRARDLFPLPAPARRRGHAAVREPARRRRLRPSAHRLHTAARHTPAADAIRLLASWNADNAQNVSQTAET